MKFYFYGFDVFKLYAASVLASLCFEAIGFRLIPLAPIDCDLPSDMQGTEFAKHIFTSNVAKMSEADGVIANRTGLRAP